MWDENQAKQEKEKEKKVQAKHSSQSHNLRAVITTSADNEPLDKVSDFPLQTVSDSDIDTLSR
jgi:hypothetical protein